MRPSHAVLAVILVLALIGVGGVRSWLAPVPAALRAGVEAARIEIRRPREDLILTRDAGGPWVVARQDDSADAEAVERMIAGLRALEFGPPIAPSQAALESGLGPADSVRLRVLDAAGGTLFDGLFGRRLFGRSAYFRTDERAQVRLATGVDPELLIRSSSQWREPRLLPGGCAAGLELIRGRGAWRRASDETARELCALRASHWATGTTEGMAGFDRPLFQARTLDGHGFTVGERRGAERLVRVDGRTALLRIPAAAIEAAAADVILSEP